ncbi:uncharacterized protein LOC144922790 [Branchiostoma floridae x Branchiostoma belcheri]
MARKPHQTLVTSPSTAGGEAFFITDDTPVQNEVTRFGGWVQESGRAADRTGAPGGRLSGRGAGVRRPRAAGLRHHVRPTAGDYPFCADRLSWYNGISVGGAPRERRAADATPPNHVVYVRWGREDCGENAKTIYSGAVGGGLFSHSGGGSDYQCLPLEDVEWNNPVPGHQHGSYMYGAEYNVNSAEYFSTDNMRHITNPVNYDVPCSVCLVSSRSAHVMIPARLSCPRGWSKEYSGYLMSGGYNDASNKNFICVDGVPELRQGSSADLNG